MAEQEFKRHIAYKLRIGDILKGNPFLEETKLKYIEVEEKKVSRINLIANLIDKFIQEGEKKFASITLDDASGQIKAKLFGDEISKFNEINQGDTLQIIGLLRSWNNEIYITPEAIKKKDPSYLLIRKLESDLEKPKSLNNTEKIELKEKIIQLVKREEDNGGLEVEKIILELKSPPNSINAEIKNLLEEGIIYEPRPGKIRYLG